MANQNLAGIKNPKTGHLLQGNTRSVLEPFQDQERIFFFPPAVTKMVKMLLAQHKSVRSQAQKSQNNLNKTFSLLGMPGHCF